MEVAGFVAEFHTFGLAFAVATQCQGSIFAIGFKVKDGLELAKIGHAKCANKVWQRIVESAIDDHALITANTGDLCFSFGAYDLE